MDKRKQNLKAFLFLLPALIIFIAFVFWPTIYNIYLSFFDWNMIKPNKEFVGISNYISIFTDKNTPKIMFNTLLYVILLVIFNFIVPYILSYVLAYIIPRFKNFFKSAFFLPSFISLVVGSMIYLWIFNPTSGPISRIFRMINIKIPNWTTTQYLVIVGICIITTWQVFGYHFITLYAAVAGIDQEIIENAHLDGISNYKIFKDIVAPMSSFTGLYILIMSIVTGLQSVYTPISVLTQGGPNEGSSNIIYETYAQAFLSFNTGEAAALSVVTLIIFSVLLLIVLKFSQERVFYEN